MNNFLLAAILFFLLLLCYHHTSNPGNPGGDPDGLVKKEIVKR